ncbi:acyltransferase family protein [Microbacterium sp. NPDC019599]|uniref:acyltransferase family protein n=1 Tax=Microbacterium sp. NPDC019599 TaxID=3154690 RepID=UPI0033CC80FE
MAEPRLGWADVARGGAMMLVVLAHTLQLMEVGGWELGWLDTANLYLTAIRMPLFFLVAGIFAARAIQRSWRALWASRLALLVYVYFLWMLLRAIWFSLVPWPLGDVEPWQAFLLSPLWPTNGLWFLFALILYIVIGRLTRRLPVWLPLGVAAVISGLAAYDLIPTGGNPVWRSIALYLLFFLLGARLSDAWKSLAARADLRLLVAALLAIPAGILLFGLLPDSLAGPARVCLSVVCVAACIVIAAMIARVRWLAAPFIGVGRRTLPIYVTHAMLLAVLVPLVPAGVTSAVVAAVLFTAVAIGLSLGLNALLGPLGGVYNLPKPIRRRLELRLRTE